MSDEAETVIPFSNGTQYMDWTERNCCRCVKGWRESQGYKCDLEIALAKASVFHGRITEAIAKRIGLPGNELALTWDCPERRAEGSPEPDQMTPDLFNESRPE